MRLGDPQAETLRLLRAALGALVDGERGVDEADVRVRLGKVAQRSARLRLDLLGVEADVVGEAEQRLEIFLRFFERAAAEREELRRPEAADAESALAARERPVVAAEEATAEAEPLADARPGAAYARRVRFAVAVPGQEQQAGVDAGAAQRARVRLELLAPTQPLPVVAGLVAGAGRHGVGPARPTAPPR